MCLNLVSGKIRRMGAGRPISAEIHCHDDTNNARQAKSLHGCNEKLSLDTEEHERKHDNIEVITLRLLCNQTPTLAWSEFLIQRRVCNIHTFVYILCIASCIIKLLNLKNNRGMLSHV